MTTATDDRSILLIGASRGLGLGMAGEFLDRGWRVVGTVRGAERTLLHDLADRHGDRLRIEQLDTTDDAAIGALRARLEGAAFDLLFVNAGILNGDRNETLGSVNTDAFVRVMVTNALAPLRVIEALDGLVRADGTIGAMSSGLGSVANNTSGGYDVYRGSKAALNTNLRSYAARTAARDPARALVALAPGWVRTDMGTSDAPFGVEEVVPMLVHVLAAQQGRPGLRYLDRFGKDVPW